MTRKPHLRLAGGSDRRNLAGEGLICPYDLALNNRSGYLSQIQRTSTTLGRLERPGHGSGHAAHDRPTAPRWSALG